MKSSSIILAIAFTVFACTPRSATKYNDEIISEQEKVMLILLEFGQAVSGGQMEKAEEARKKGVEQTEESLKRLEKLGDFQGNTEFRDAAIELMRHYNVAFTSEYKDIVLLVKKEADMSPEDYEKLEEIESLLNSKERAVNKKLLEAQNNFAREHNFTVEENDLQKEVDDK